MLGDVIVALATAPGRAALAIVRLSGGAAFDVAGRVVEGFTPAPPRRATLASFRTASGEELDRGIYLAFPGPRSYTGEDTVEFTCHGGAVVPARLLAALEAAGARPAHPGEFTRRAVLNGKMDLVQAEAVGDLIDASAPAQARMALDQLDGGLSRRIEVLREDLVRLLALLSYDIDFPEEDDPPVARTTVAAGVAEVTAKIDLLVRTAPTGRRLRDGATVVIAGRPNVGKSSLFNALLGIDRTIVTDVPGTTRDAVEAETDFLGWPIRLVDTAGLRNDAGEIELRGVEIGRRYQRAADLVLVCVEAGRELDASERELLSPPTGSNPLLVRTKSDLADEAAGGIAVSSVTGQGLDLLRKRVAEHVFGERIRLLDLEPALTRERHRRALTRAAEALRDAARELTNPRGDTVLVAHHVREAADALDVLIGVVDIENVLDAIFSSFCVGK